MLNERSYVVLNLIHIQDQFEKFYGKTENINLLENDSITVFSRRVNFFSFFLKNLRDGFL